MYFVKNFYSKSAWDEWKSPAKECKSQHRTTEYGGSHEFKTRDDWREKITFDIAAKSFAELAERVAFLQLMNKRHVLYYRGSTKDYGASEGMPGMDLPSIFRTGESKEPYSVDQQLEVLDQRWGHLLNQARAWREILNPHPRPRTVKHYPEAAWAVQQHYKDLLPKASAGGSPAESFFLDVTSSLRVAAAFALPNDGSGERAYVSVIALPQTTGSITFNADEQLELMRLSALCPPSALRPHLQEGYLVGRFPRPALEEIKADTRSMAYDDYVRHIEEFYSLRRRTIARIPLQPTTRKEFWGEHGLLDSDALLKCPWFEKVKSQFVWEGGHLTFRS